LASVHIIEKATASDSNTCSNWRRARLRPQPKMRNRMVRRLALVLPSEETVQFEAITDQPICQHGHRHTLRFRFEVELAHEIARQLR